MAMNDTKPRKTDKLATGLVGKTVTVLKPRANDPLLLNYDENNFPERFRGKKGEVASVYLEDGRLRYSLLIGGNLWEDVSPALFRVGEIDVYDSGTWGKVGPCPACQKSFVDGEQVHGKHKEGGWVYHHFGCSPDKP